jgi:3-ketosteroid 9alpha-monooxygenase subunit B
MTGTSPAPASSLTPSRHRFYRLPVKRVVQETPEAVSLAFDIPDDLRGVFRYKAGQFVTVRAEIEGAELFRSYSMSSAPEVDKDLVITVKRIPDGIVSGWLTRDVREGHSLDVNPPSGRFVLDEESPEIVAFVAGSGMTPVFSILKSALATTRRRVRVLYANRDQTATIFKEALDTLAADHPDRLEILNHLDVEHGFVDTEAVNRFAGDHEGVQYFVCGPTPFMEVVETALIASGATPDHVHIERFTPQDDGPPIGEVDDIRLTVTLDGKTTVVAHRSGSTILQTARSAGLRAPSSCEAGDCATCMARVLEGRAEMRRNAALTDEEVDEGWILTCQAVPVTPQVKVVYE